MPKKMDDMIKIKVIKKAPSIQRVELERPPRDVRPEPIRQERQERQERYVPPVQKSYPPNIKKPRKGPRYLLWIVAAVCIAFLFFSLSFMFSSSEISITPKIQEVTLNENLTATKDSEAAVPFDLMVIAGEETTKIKAETKEDFAVKAKGVVIIYNAFSSSSQLLSIDTRLEGSNGKMYKTEKKILVPGMGKDGTPGKVEVGIYGSEGGEDYNSTPLDFKIFGFKGTSKYEKIYARSKGDITGGVKGEYYTVPDAEKEKAVGELKTALEAKLFAKASGQIPEGFVLFKDAVFLSVNEGSVESFSKEQDVPITLKGTLYGFLFDEKKLTKKIATDVLDKYDGSDIYIHNLKDIPFTLTDRENISFADAKTINFSLKGKAQIVWRFDTAKFTSDLLGHDKKEFNTILSKYPNVASANLLLKPFWRMSFSDKAKDIHVNVGYPE